MWQEENKVRLPASSNWCLGAHSLAITPPAHALGLYSAASQLRQRPGLNIGMCSPDFFFCFIFLLGFWIISCFCLVLTFLKVRQFFFLMYLFTQEMALETSRQIQLYLYIFISCCYRSEGSLCQNFLYRIKVLLTKRFIATIQGRVEQSYITCIVITIGKWPGCYRNIYDA